MLLDFEVDIQYITVDNGSLQSANEAFVTKIYITCSAVQGLIAMPSSAYTN